MNNETYADPKANLSPDMVSTVWPTFKTTRYLNNAVVAFLLITIIVTLVMGLALGNEYIYLAIIIPFVSLFWLVSFSLKKRERANFRLAVFIVNALICVLCVVGLVLNVFVTSKPIPPSIFIVSLFFLNTFTLYKARRFQ